MIHKSEFYFIRHGQTDLNLFPRSDFTDVELNAAGREQAMRVEPLIASLPVRSICFSPLKRAKETKDLCCKQLKGAGHHQIEALAECDLATWHQMTALGKEAKQLREGLVFDFMARAVRGMNDALEKEGPVLIIAHGGIYWALACLLEIDADWMIDHCVLVRFTHRGKWELQRMSS